MAVSSRYASVAGAPVGDAAVSIHVRPSDDDPQVKDAEAKPRPAVSRVNKLLLCVTLAAMTSFNTLFTAWSQNHSGGYSYNTATIPFVCEVLKLVGTLASMLWAREALVVRAAFFRYTVLALLFTYQKLLVFQALRTMDIATFQILMNLRIPITAVLMRLFLQRQFTQRQLIGITLLLIGACLSRYQPSTRSIDASLTVLESVGLIVLAASIASVLNERWLKSDALGSLRQQNLQLYMCGAVCAFVLAWADTERTHHGFFYNYNGYTWLVIINLSVMGIFTSMVFKYADSIVLSFAGALSVLLSTVASWYYFKMQLTLWFAMAVFSTCSALFLYNR